MREMIPADWVVRWADCLPREQPVLDLACGRGRHARWLAEQGFSVLAVDRDEAALASLAGVAGVTPLCADLEAGAWPLAGQTFSGIVVTNYLWRPRWDALADLLAPGGVLIYETFMVGQAAFGKPGNPDFLLLSQELLHRALLRQWQVLGYAEGLVPGLAEQRMLSATSPATPPAMRQSLCARRC